MTATAVFAGDQGEDVAEVLDQLGVSGLSRSGLRAATDAAIADAGGLVSSRGLLPRLTPATAGCPTRS